LDPYFRQKNTYFSELNIMAYQLYRNTTLGSTLQETLDEFIQSGQITQQLAFKVLQAYDRTMNKALSTKVRSKIQFRAGKLCTYRFCDNVWTFVMEQIEFRDSHEVMFAEKVKFVACDGRSNALLSSEPGSSTSLPGFVDQSGWYGAGGEWSGYEMPSDAQKDYSHKNYLYSNKLNSGNYYGTNFAHDQLNEMEQNNYLDEPPLLEELGINFHHIWQKTMSVLNPFKEAEPAVINDCDLAGPVVFALLFGSALLFHGKVQFGYIYGVGVVGCLGMFTLLNLMTPYGISLISTVSIVGYCLLPMVLLSTVAAIFSFKDTVGLAISAFAVLWCSASASKLFVTALVMNNQWMLVAYPCFLLYGVFALLAVF
ncbi:Protein YIPF5, partial [Trichinella patagoniensis]